MENKLHCFLGPFSMQKVSQSASSNFNGFIEIDGCFGEELEGVEAIGLPGIVAPHQQRQIVQPIQFSEFDALEISYDGAPETQLSDFHLCRNYISFFVATLNGIP
jgi:hypothetical protein